MNSGLTNRPGWPTEDDIDPQNVLSALDDDGCRAILEATSDEALTATELADQCDIPTSTAYRKVEKLTDADLVDEQVRINTSGKHATEYHRSFDDIVVSVSETDGIEVNLRRSEAAADTESMSAVASD